MNLNFPKIPDSVRFAILIPTARWSGEVKAILASFVGVAGGDVAVLIADNSELIEKHVFLESLNKINDKFIPFFHDKNIGAKENFYFLLDWSSDVDYVAIMADDDFVTPTYYLDAYSKFKDNPGASCISVGTSLVDFGDCKPQNITQPSMTGDSPIERMRSWNGLNARITMYDVSRRAALDNAIRYLKATPLLGLTLMEDVFELSRLASGDFLCFSGHGLFIHYPHHGSRSKDSADRFYKLLCEEFGLKRPMLNLMGLSTAIQVALFLLGDFSPIKDKKQRNLCAQHVFNHLFFSGFHRDFSKYENREFFRRNLVSSKAALEGFDYYSNLDKTKSIRFGFDLVNWFVELVKVFESTPEVGKEPLSKQFLEFCSGILRDDHFDLSVEGKAVTKNESDQHSPKNSWSISDWLNDRTPGASRVRALTAMLDANPSVGTQGVVVIVPKGTDSQVVAITLESLGAQHRPIDKVWLIGDIPTIDLKQSGVECMPTELAWVKVLSDLIVKGGMPDFMWILEAGDRLLTHATLTMGEYRLRKPDALIWYTDEAVWSAGGCDQPVLKPDFNIDLLRSYPYVGRNLVVSTAAVQAVGGLHEGFGGFALVDFLWRVVEKVGPSAVAHIAEVLYLSSTSLLKWVRDETNAALYSKVTQAHFGRLGLDAKVEPGPALGLCRVRYPLMAQPLVSIIIPTRDQLPVLRACVEGLMERTAYSNYELLIVDNASAEPGAVEFLRKLEELSVDGVRILRWSKAFDFAAMNNFAAKEARGDVLLFLNNDIQFSAKTRPDWLERLLTLVMRPEVGAAGARLNLPDGRVDQCGLVLGMDNSVGMAFRGLSVNLPGNMFRLIAQQNVSALSASCLMMRRVVFDELGGFDAKSFPIYYADADLCMKATQAGYLLALEPDTGLLHMGGASRLQPEKFGLLARPDDEQRDKLYSRWLPQLARDPYYHPAFGKNSPGFNISPDASRIHDPLPGRPLPIVLAVHCDWQGCGYYRVLHPYRALADELRLEGGLKHLDYHFTDVARIQPDIIVLQGTWRNKGILNQIRRYREITGAKVILEFDDYIPNIPTRSVFRKLVPQSVLKDMRRAIEQVDWLVVSTPVLAQEYAKYHDDIRVALNGLSPGWWRGLSGARRRGKKMRVGWAGGSSHTGDLAEIRSVVKELEDEVEWVFMGMQPQDVRCEFHQGVVIDKYPAKLASLDLDLAVVPLEMNQFNRCKSNLRLLELGACGVPIVCTDIEPYRTGLPVTLVPNKHQAWVEAIRAHLADPEALAHSGDTLRDAVMRDWMLEGGFLDQWALAWGVSPGR